jgi:hypothetical protein
VPKKVQNISTSTNAELIKVNYIKSAYRTTLFSEIPV